MTLKFRADQSFRLSLDISDAALHTLIAHGLEARAPQATLSYLEARYTADAHAQNEFEVRNAQLMLDQSQVKPTLMATVLDYVAREVFARLR